MLDLSVIIPAYNEQLRLPSTLASVHGFLSEHLPNFEIVIVNDGSKDETAQIVQEFAKHYDRIRLISYDRNKGKGYAVKTGVLAARGRLLLVDDADGSSPIEEVLRLKEAVLTGADLVIGSRAKPDPSRCVKARAYRTYIGNIFSKIVQTFALPGLYDTQCGFKLFKQAPAQDIFSLARIDGYAFDVEILYIAKQRNYVIEEVAINWNNVDGSKINLLLDPLKMLWEIIKIRINDRLGLYRNRPEVKTHD